MRRAFISVALALVLFGASADVIALTTDATSAETPSIRLELAVSGFAKPTAVTNAGDGSGRLFVAEKPGRIQIVRDGAVLATPYLDINDIVRTKGNEQGLLSLAFHPGYGSNGQFFVDYTNNAGDVVIARYRVSDANPDRADPASAEILLTISKPYDDHNAGQLAFGPDGYLYIGVGDGGAESEPDRNAQRTTTLLGKILRIDVDHAENGRPYAIPADNPFVGSDSSLPEIWAYGLRNPWRFSFDQATGDLYIADVGLWSSEEVNIQENGTPGGRNYGWNIVEGEICHDQERADRCASSELTSPVFVYHHDAGCAIVGGYVYHGVALPEIQDRYLFGDFCLGNIWTLARDGDAWIASKPLATGKLITTFGVDEAGELYLGDLGGNLYRIVSA